jgi:hypothetical protein
MLSACYCCEIAAKIVDKFLVKLLKIKFREYQLNSSRSDGQTKLAKTSGEFLQILRECDQKPKAAHTTVGT